MVKVLGGLMKKYPFLSVVPLTLIGYFVLLHVNITSAPVYGQQISNLSQSNALLTCTRLMVKGLLFVLPNKKQSVVNYCALVFGKWKPFLDLDIF